MLRKSLLIVAGCGLLSTAAWSEQFANHIHTVENAKRVNVVQPTYPVAAAKRKQEGWVRLSFVIDKNGNVIDPVVEDASGAVSFEKEAIEAAKRWKFKPATLNNEPIEQSQNDVIFEFKLDSLAKEKRGVSQKFMLRYKRISKALELNDLVAAKEDLDRLNKDKQWNITENDWFWLLNARYHRLAGNNELELASLKKATFGKQETLKQDNYLYVLSRTFNLQVQLKRYSEALSTFSEIQKTEEQKVIAKYSPYAYKIRQLITSDEPLVYDATVSSRQLYINQLVRNKISIVDIQGELQAIELRCQNKRSTFTVAEGSIWSIPVSWGKCSAYVSGEKGATFKLIQLSNNAET